MNTGLRSEQRILQNARAVSLGSSIESFVIARRSEGLAHCTIKFYRQNLHPFHICGTHLPSTGSRSPHSARAKIESSTMLCNAEMRVAEVRQYGKLGEAGEALWRAAMGRGCCKMSPIDALRR